jgi:hypothetical protein
MRVIITGGTGLIGQELAGSLVRDGHEVIALSRRPSQKQPISGSGVRIELWDGKTAQGWGHLAEGAGAIVNLAGENIGAGRWNQARKRAILESRIQAGEAVSEAVANAKVKPAVVVQISGVGYYGIHGDEMISESSSSANDYLSKVCQAWESATAPVEDDGVRRVIARSGVVLSTKGGALPRMLLPFKFFVGGRLGSGKQWISWIHMQDQVAGLRYFIENPNISGVYNLTSPYPIQNAELAKTIGRIMHRPSFFPVPAFAIRLIFGEMATTVLDGQRVLPERLEKAGFVFNYPRIGDALKQLLSR